MSQPPSHATAGAPEPVGVGLSDEPSAPRTRKTGLLVGGVAALALLGGGAAFAASQLGGGGAQPADVLPGDAYAYARVDIDPSAGQKIAAVRFLDKVPKLGDTLGSGDPRQKLWNLLAKDAGSCVQGYDYAKDIAPWLGDRAGVAVRPGGTKDQPNVVVAVQVKDEATASGTLGKLLGCAKGDQQSELRMKDGYALITPKGQADATVAAVDKGTLASNTTFSGDMQALGEQGVMSLWVDAAPAVKALGDAAGAGTASAPVTGRAAMALRFDPGYVEVAGTARGTTGVTKVAGGATELTTLPQDTVGAIQVSGAGQLLDAAWPQLKKVIDDAAAKSGQDDPVGMIEQQLDVKLPDDLKVLLGSSLTVAVPAQDFGSSALAIGGKTVTSNAKRAGEVLTSITDAAGGALTLDKKVVGDKVYVASTPDYLDKLVTGGRLGDSDAFKVAVGDTKDTNVAVFVDLDRIEKHYLSAVDEQARPAVEALRAVGLNSVITGAGEQRFTLRLVGN
ncbi:MAG TPA: DUF3352 domain-containing protein [Intrasporangium sp.]|uniref:DUF3352 domain-containing protein n=1 Tax=Intrasporangium sp. TaxID=1925024 RepID=UPI002D78648F|nr:DUF3352 domain-containing protein [Intrasporangium sp.]HET7397941.1 DUF3352 domain-containing protein [Intrasporangium sp.]